VPLPTGGFEARLSVQPDPKARLVPGMNCKVALGETQKSEPLRAPKEAVSTEGNQHYVFVFKGDSPAERRVVKTGDADDKTIEILDGLSEGDKILLSKPK